MGFSFKWLVKIVVEILAGYVVFFVFFSHALAAEENLIRVKLGSFSQQVDFRVMEGSYRLVDGKTGLTINEPKAGEFWSIIKEGPVIKVAKEGQSQEAHLSGPIILEPLRTGNLNLFRYQNIRYRDKLMVCNETTGLIAVNILGMEAYLNGVVGREMGTSAPLEALKAQAVVSRSYACCMKGSGVFYDVTFDTSSQVYGGYDAEQEAGATKVKEAVASTAGEVIYYDNQIVQAYYHANAGGYTEASENVWKNPLPYLKPVPSPHDVEALNYPHQVSGWPANTYRWQKKLSREQLSSQVDQWNNEKSGFKENQIQVGDLKDLKAFRLQADGCSTTRSGRVTELKLIGSQGEKSFYKDNIRSFYNLRSTLFTINLDSQVYIYDQQGRKTEVTNGENLIAVAAGGVAGKVNGNSGTYYIQSQNGKKVVPKVFQEVIFNGRGHGHGLGMSQWGARGMANNGYTYREIIQHYYRGEQDGHVSIKRLKG